MEVLLHTLPLLIMLGLVYMMLKHFQEKEDKKFLLELQKDVKKHSYPLRLQAYERLVLLAERIEPAAMFTRLDVDAANAGQIQMLMLLSLQQEFEHNLAQQLYVSSQAWAQLIKAKQQLMNIIQLAGSAVDKAAPTSAFAKSLFEQLEKTPPADLLIAKSALKEEVTKLF